MKKRFFAIIAAVAMTVTSVPAITLAADGGLYAELLQNGSFEMDDPLYSWETDGDVKVNTEKPMNENNLTYVTLGKNSSIINDGFGGINVKKGEKYKVSLNISAIGFEIKMELIGDDGQVIAKTGNGGGGGICSAPDAETAQAMYEKMTAWKKIENTLEPKADAKNAKLKITVLSAELDIDMVSLMPERQAMNEERNRENENQEYTDLMAENNKADSHILHTPYISGYPDGTFRPDNTISRFEMAVIFSKLGGIDENKKYEHNFEDISKDEWYSNYVGFAAQKGYIDGCGGYGSINGHFMPGEDTRAMFAVAICNYLGLGHYEPQDTQYSDVNKSHWGSGYIQALADKGLIEGYSDGTFRPDNNITRAEAVTMINKALGRIDVTAQNLFSDVSPSHWAYNEILKAVQ